jgi:hypothetical protein
MGEPAGAATGHFRVRIFSAEEIQANLSLILITKHTIASSTLEGSHVWTKETVYGGSRFEGVGEGRGYIITLCLMARVVWNQCVNLTNQLAAQAKTD